MYPLRRIGDIGGLKNIEKLLWIARSEDTEGLTDLMPSGFVNSMRNETWTLFENSLKITGRI